MARFRRKRRSYGGRVRSYARRARSSLGGGGKFGGIITGLMGGIARQVGAKYLPGYGAPLGEAAVGYFMKNQTAMYMAGRDLGGTLAGSFLGGGASSTPSGTFQ